MNCTICHRLLTDPASIQRGYGEDCAKKYQRYLAQAGTTLEEIGLLAMHDDPTVRRWVEVARRALASKLSTRFRDARQFIENARIAANAGSEKASVLSHWDSLPARNEVANA